MPLRRAGALEQPHGPLVHGLDRVGPNSEPLDDLRHLPAALIADGFDVIGLPQCVAPTASSY